MNGGLTSSVISRTSQWAERPLGYRVSYGFTLLLAKDGDEVGLLAADGESGGLEAFLEFSHGEFGQVLCFSRRRDRGRLSTPKPGVVDFDERDLAALTASRMMVTRRNFIMAALVSNSMVCGMVMLRSSPSNATPKSLWPVLDSRRAMTCSSFLQRP